MLKSLARTIAGTFAAAFLAMGMMAGSANAQFWGGYGDNSVYDWAHVKFSKKYSPGQIIVSFGDRRLYYIEERGQAISYPIAVPRPESRWQGTLRVSLKRVDPPWTPTAEMRQENPKLPAFVPGGHPRNPLGKRALYLGSTLYRIHGTDAPWTIGDNVSKGCIRMHDEHVIDLYTRVSVGTRVTATWKQYETQLVETASAAGSSSGGGNWQRRALGLNY